MCGGWIVKSKYGVVQKLRNAAGLDGWFLKCYENVTIGRLVVNEMLRNAKNQVQNQFTVSGRIYLD